MAGVLLVFGYQATVARSALNDAADGAALLQSQVVAGDVSGARETLADLQGSTDRARGVTSGVLWRLGSSTPWVGDDIQAVRTVSREMDRVVDQAVPPIVDLAGELNAKTFNPADGTFDIGSIVAVAPATARAAATLGESDAALSKIDSSSLIAPLRAPVSTVQAQVDVAASAAHNASLAARLLPQMLGVDGTRRYALLVQNNAESRADGGIVGSYSVIEAKRGRVKIIDQGNASDVFPTGRVPKMSKDEKRVFPSTMVSDLRDTTATPDFPRAAALASRLISKGRDIPIDGAFTVDPVAMGYLMDGIGSVKIRGDIVLDASNTASALLHQVYMLLDDPRAQDEFFRIVTRRIFNRFTAGDGDAQATLKALVRGVEENRISLWSARDAEQEVIASTDLSGSLPKDNGTTPNVGMYVSDAASGKMEYFLKTTPTIASVRCPRGDLQQITLVSDLQSTAPTTGLTKWVTGTGEYVAKGSMRLNIRLMAPYKGYFTSITLDGEPVTISADRLYGRAVSRLEVVLRPGERKTLKADVISGPGQVAPPVFNTTPGVDSLRNGFSASSSCSA